MNSAFAVPAFGPALPEIILAVGVLGLILIGAFRGQRSNDFMNVAALVLLGLAFLAVIGLPTSPTETLGGSFITDAFAKFMKILTLIGAAAAIVMSTDYLRR